MTNINFKYYKANTLVGFILILGTIISILVFYLTKELAFLSKKIELLQYFTFPATSVIVLMILKFYNKHLWKLKFFNHLVWIPNIKGRYEGEIYFTHPISKEKTTMKSIVIVHQTASVVKINSFFKKLDGTNTTPSESKVANIVKEDDNSFSLVYTYENKGTQGSDEFSPHYGTNHLKFIDTGKEKILTGYYYTNRNPQTKGEMKVKYINNNSHHEF